MEQATISKIFPRLYIANYLAIDDEDFLLDHEISHAILIDEKKRRKWDEIETFEIVVGENPAESLEKVLNQAFDFIEEGRADDCAVALCCKDKISAYSGISSYYLRKPVFVHTISSKN